MSLVLQRTMGQTARRGWHPGLTPRAMSSSRSTSPYRHPRGASTGGNVVNPKGHGARFAESDIWDQVSRTHNGSMEGLPRSQAPTSTRSVPTAPGAYQRTESTFRDWIRKDGSTPFAPEAHRYHLYLARACPWSHRVAITRELRGLTDVISASWAAPYRDERGWAFPGGNHRDNVNGFAFLADAYDACSPTETTRPTLPVLWDTQTATIVNNESGEIMRMLAMEFAAPDGRPSPDLYPDALRPEIDRLNAWAYDTIQNGVYGCGFAKTQDAYDASFDSLFDALSELDALLAERRYLAGDALTEADWRLFPTLVRFDAVYHTHFRCNGRRLTDHPHSWAYARELFQVPGIADTVDFDEIKTHYYTTHADLNPRRIVARGPIDADWTLPHDRGTSPSREP